MDSVRLTTVTDANALRGIVLEQRAAIAECETRIRTRDAWIRAAAVIDLKRKGNIASFELYSSGHHVEHLNVA